MDNASLFENKYCGERRVTSAKLIEGGMAIRLDTTASNEYVENCHIGALYLGKMLQK